MSMSPIFLSLSFRYHSPWCKTAQFRYGASCQCEVKVRLSTVFENGEKAYNQYRRERFLLKTKKLAVTIPKRNLPKFDTVADPKCNAASYITTSKALAAAQRDIEIVRERGMPLDEIFSHNLLPTQPTLLGRFHFCHTR